MTFGGSEFYIFDIHVIHIYSSERNSVLELLGRNVCRNQGSGEWRDSCQQTGWRACDTKDFLTNDVVTIRVVECREPAATKGSGEFPASRLDIGDREARREASDEMTETSAPVSDIYHVELALQSEEYCSAAPN